MEWEKIYVNALMQSLHPFGDLLQVGFRSSLVADEIHKYRPRNHVLIESRALQMVHAKQWAQKHGAVFEEMEWVQVLPRLGVFDTIFFDASLGSEIEKTDPLIQEVEGRIPHLTKMRYADSDLESFCEKSAKEVPESVYRFLQELEQNGQISKEQREKMIKKFHLTGGDVKPVQKKQVDQIFAFLKECFVHHMRKGSRFSCFLDDSTSKYEDRKFFEEIISNPWIEYREQVLSIPKKGEVLILLVEKLG